MRTTDPIADMLTRIRNAIHAGKTFVTVPGSNMKSAIANLLKEEGYLDEVEFLKNNHQGDLFLRLRLYKDLPVIAGLRRISRPGRRQYVKASEIPKVLGGLGICILSTSKGILTGQEAVRHNIGGEVLCEVW
ncbi:MAG: 30S ribosomal protein S8 [Bradymonadales bacterium]|nr:30S ribosomal protein S8 [Bradymonadales bacterium]